LIDLRLRMQRRQDRTARQSVMWEQMRSWSQHRHDSEEIDSNELAYYTVTDQNRQAPDAVSLHEVDGRAQSQGFRAWCYTVVPDLQEAWAFGTNMKHRSLFFAEQQF